MIQPRPDNTVTFANPIFDAAFKYLFEDQQAAKIILSQLLDVEVLEIKNLPTEHQIPVGYDESGALFAPIRLDFALLVKDKNGDTKRVVVEMQNRLDKKFIERMRVYIASGYNDKENADAALFFIFLLGFLLEGVKTAIIRTHTQMIDVLSGEVVECDSKLVNGLIHNNIIVQLRRIKGTGSPLELLLKLFSFPTKMKEVTLDRTDPSVEQFAYLVERMQLAGIPLDVLAGIDKQYARELEVIEAKEEAEQAVKRVEEVELRLEEAERQKIEAERQKIEAERQKIEAERQKIEAERREREAERREREAERQKIEAQDREAQMQRMLVTTLHQLGKSNQHIAEELSISIAEVKQILNAQ